MVLRMRCCSHSLLLTKFTHSHSNRLIPLQRRGRRERTILSISNVRLNKQNRLFAASASCKAPSASISEPTPLKGLQEVLMDYISGKSKATEVAHLVWNNVVQKGDTVIDATCGNGYDTLTMLKLVADESGGGRVYGMDTQKDALENTSSLLTESLNPNEKELVKLFPICHSRMEEIVPKGAPVRLVAFNLGYLPGGDKAITTTSETTLVALGAAERILMPGGLISVVAYVGHPGGREEFKTVQDFASRLSVEKWVCCQFQMLNRPLAPVLIFLFKK